MELFFSSCTKCPALTGSTDLVYAPVPRRRSEPTDLDSTYGVPAYGNSFRTKKIVSPRPPSVSIGFWIILLLTVGLGSVRADLLDSSINERTSNPADLEKANIDTSSPAAGTEGSHKWSFDVLREEEFFCLLSIVSKERPSKRSALSCFWNASLRTKKFFSRTSRWSVGCPLSPRRPNFLEPRVP